VSKVSPELLAASEELVELVPEARRKLVVGSPTCLAGGHVFFGVHATGLFVRWAVEAAAELCWLGGRPLEAMAGRPMGGFSTLPVGLPGTEQWVRRSCDYARTVPTNKPRSAPVGRP